MFFQSLGCFLDVEFSNFWTVSVFAIPLVCNGLSWTTFWLSVFLRKVVEMKYWSFLERSVLMDVFNVSVYLNSALVFNHLVLENCYAIPLCQGVPGNEGAGLWNPAMLRIQVFIIQTREVDWQFLPAHPVVKDNGCSNAGLFHFDFHHRICSKAASQCIWSLSFGLHSSPKPYISQSQAILFRY